MSLLREPTSRALAQFMVPTKGTQSSVAVHMVPLDALYTSMNVFVRKGKLRQRPGLRPLNATVFVNPIIGGRPITTPTTTMVLAFARDRVYELSDTDTVWTSTLSGSNLVAPSDQDTVDVAVLETAGEYMALVAERHSPLHKWTQFPRRYAVITGSNIPNAQSVCIAASRVVALVAPHTVVWSATLDPTNFSALAYAKRAQTGDAGICVRSLSTLAFVLYKERSIHPARAQAGGEDTAFTFAEPLQVSGPAGLHAVVEINGTHVYMTRNGRIALYNGTSYPQWIADGLWLFLQDDIDQRLAYQIRGVYDHRLHTVTFWYPRVAAPYYLSGMVVITMPFEGIDVAEQGPQRPQAFLGVCRKAITHACAVYVASALDRSLLFTATSGTVNDAQSFVYDEATNVDGTLAYPCAFQTGLQAMPDARHGMFVIETFAERGAGYGSVQVEPVISDSLENEAGTIPSMTAQRVDLAWNPVTDYRGFNKKVRFFGLRYSWTSTSTFRYSGAVVYSAGKAT